MNSTSMCCPRSAANKACRSATIVARWAAIVDTPTAATVRVSNEPGTRNLRLASNAVMPSAAGTA
eukprot:6392380-Amphidinium_carterae.1